MSLTSCNNPQTRGSLLPSKNSSPSGSSSIACVTNKVVIGGHTAGVYISADSGANFTHETDVSAPSGGMTGVAMSCDGNTVYAIDAGNFYKSTDGGVTYAAPVTAGGGIGASSFAQMRGLVISGTTVYIATNQVTDGGLAISTDSGATFTTYTGGLSSLNLSSVAVSGTTVVVGTDAGVGVSVDGGHNFTMKTQAGNSLGSDNVTAVAVSGSLITTADGNGGSVSQNAGNTFISHATPGMSSSTSISGTTVYIGVGQGGAKGVSIGTPNGMGGYNFNDVSAGPGDFTNVIQVFGALVFEGWQDGLGSFYKSTDNGVTFNLIGSVGEQVDFIAFPTQ